MNIKPSKGCSSDVLAQIAEVVPVPVIISNFGGEGIFDHKIAFANSAFTKLTGFKTEHLIGRSPEFLYDRNAEKAEDSIMEFYNKCGYSDEFEVEIRSLTKTGDSKNLKANIVASTGETAEVKSFIITFTEIAQAAAQQSTDIEPEQFEIPVAPVVTAQKPARATEQFDIPVAPVVTNQESEQPATPENFDIPVAPVVTSKTPEIEQEQQASYATAQQVSELQNLMRQKQELQDKLRNKKTVEDNISSIKIANTQEPEKSEQTAKPKKTLADFVPTDYDSIISEIAADLGGEEEAEIAETIAETSEEIYGTGVAFEDPAEIAAKSPVAEIENAELTGRHSVLENMIQSIRLKTSQDISNDAKITELKSTVEDKQIEDEIDYYAKTRFLSNMSHDLRTPLNAIIGFSEVIRDQLFGPIDNQRYVSYANDIFKSGQELLATISEILELSEVDTENNLELEEEEFDICETIDSVLDLLSAKAFQTDVKMMKRLAVSDMLMNGDRRKLKQAVGGIIGNAIKSSPSGGKIEIVSEIDDNGDFRLITYLKSANLVAAKASMGTLLGSVTNKVESEYPEISLAKRFTEAHDGKFSIFNSATSGTEISLTIPKNRLIDGRKAKLQVINNS